MGFNATLTANVISWRSVMHMCFLAFSHTSTNTTFLSKATNYFSHMLLQKWEAKICRKGSLPSGIELTTTRSWVTTEPPGRAPKGFRKLLTTYVRHKKVTPTIKVLTPDNNISIFSRIKVIKNNQVNMTQLISCLWKGIKEFGKIRKRCLQALFPFPKIFLKALKVYLSLLNNVMIKHS